MFKKPDIDPFADKKCASCWRKGIPLGCPCWVEPLDGFMEQDSAGTQRLVTGCMYQVLPRMIVHTVKAAHHAAASGDKSANESAKVVEVVARVLSKATQDYNQLRLTSGKIDSDPSA